MLLAPGWEVLASSSSSFLRLQRVSLSLIRGFGLLELSKLQNPDAVVLGKSLVLFAEGKVLSFAEAWTNFHEELSRALWVSAAPGSSLRWILHVHPALLMDICRASVFLESFAPICSIHFGNGVRTPPAS